MPIVQINQTEIVFIPRDYIVQLACKQGFQICDVRVLQGVLYQHGLAWLLILCRGFRYYVDAGLVPNCY